MMRIYVNKIGMIVFGVVLIFVFFCPVALAVSDQRRGQPFCRRELRLAQNIRPGGKYIIGVGKADITGPVAELALAGYGKFEQTGSGLRQRLYSRAFVVADADAPHERVAYLVLDNLAGDTAVKYGVIEALAAAGKGYGVYKHHNIALTATHTHAGPGGWFNYLLPQAPTLGFHNQSYRAIVDGAALSIKRAHDSMEEGYLDIGTTEIDNASINRSPYAYLKNPEAERQKYDADVDTTMTVLRFQRARDRKNIGILSWFPVHGTSIHNNNTHTAGDNKGVAAWLFEKAMREEESAADGFVAGFSQSNEGDVSPNVLGSWCEDSGSRCSFDASTCNDGTTQKCQGRGPRYDAADFGMKSCFEIGKRQYEGAKRVFDDMDTNSTPIEGAVKSFHFFQNMSYWNFTTLEGRPAMTCPPAFGYSAVAGCTDGAGMKGFRQGTLGDLPKNLWTYFFTSLRRPTAQQRACHYPKPILFDASLSWPYEWAASIVDVQMLRIGQLLIATSPSEITTMSGRRWRNAIRQRSKSILVNEAIPIVAGPANTYAHYVTTPEEYSVQRYEGGSTMFGPNQLSAFINLTTNNMHFLADQAPPRPVSKTQAPDNRLVSFSLFPRVFFDRAPRSQSFGSVLKQPHSAYHPGETAVATFQGACPRNNLRLEETFAAVEYLSGDEGWIQVLDDSDWFLIFTWRRTNTLLGYSEVDITWEIPEDITAGTYRLRYYGDAKRIARPTVEIHGVSNTFDVL